MNASLIQIASTAPRLLVLVGLVTALAFAIARRHILGRAATPALAGLTVLMVSSVLDILTLLIIYFGYFHHSWLPMGDYVAIRSMISGVSGLLWAGGMAMVIVAVFAGRKAVTAAPDHPSPPDGPLP